MVSLNFLRINVLSLSITFFWSQLKVWSTSQQFLAVSFLSQHSWNPPPRFSPSIHFSIEKILEKISQDQL